MLIPSPLAHFNKVFGPVPGIRDAHFVYISPALLRTEGCVFLKKTTSSEESFTKVHIIKVADPDLTIQDYLALPIPCLHAGPFQSYLSRVAPHSLFSS